MDSRAVVNVISFVSVRRHRVGECCHLYGGLPASRHGRLARTPMAIRVRDSESSGTKGGAAQNRYEAVQQMLFGAMQDVRGKFAFLSSRDMSRELRGDPSQFADPSFASLHWASGSRWSTVHDPRTI